MIPDNNINWFLERLTNKEIQLFDTADESGLIFLLNGDLYRINDEFEKICNIDKNDSRISNLTYFEMFETIDDKKLKGIKSTAPGR